MKRIKYILPGLLLSAVLIAAMCMIGLQRIQSEQRNDIHILDAAGQNIASISSLEELRDDSRWAYIEYVLDEAAWILSRQNGITLDEGISMLFQEGYTIKTAFDKTVYDAIEKAASKWSDQFPIGCAFTDLNGNLVAIYSTPGEENQARTQTSPYSTLKPLSVYAPAMEAGISHWSMRYEDSPYKQLPEESGGGNWPSNASGTYSGEKVFMYQAVKESLNTVAVKSLANLGVNNSIAFMQGNFPLDLETEAFRSKDEGEEEIIGNIALGYLQAGVTTMDMAGCYQIFATGGIYTEVAAVLELWDEENNIVYNRIAQNWQAVAPETADCINKMLQGAVSEGGIGENAASPGVEVAGQTGIRDDRSVNWFVGVTPGYSCAVRHGDNPENIAPEIFSQIINTLYQNSDKETSFAVLGNIQQEKYCVLSGLAASDACPVTEIGYYAENTQHPLCKQQHLQEQEKGE